MIYTVNGVYTSTTVSAGSFIRRGGVGGGGGPLLVVVVNARPLCARRAAQSSTRARGLFYYFPVSRSVAVRAFFVFPYFFLFSLVV